MLFLLLSIFILLIILELFFFSDCIQIEIFVISYFICDFSSFFNSFWSLFLLSLKFSFNLSFLFSQKSKLPFGLVSPNDEDKTSFSFLSLHKSFSFFKLLFSSFSSI